MSSYLTLEGATIQLAPYYPGMVSNPLKLDKPQITMWYLAGHLKSKKKREKERNER